MEQRILGRTDQPVSVIGLGTWQLGGDWGEVTEDAARSVLAALSEPGSRCSTPPTSTVAAAASRSSARSCATTPATASPWPPRWAASWSRCRRATRWRTSGPGPTSPEPTSASTGWTWSSCTAHRPRCSPPTRSTTRWTPCVAEDRIAAYGVSVETCDQALTAISRHGTATVQIILNAFQTKPLEHVLPAAQVAGVGIIARVPLASGLLSGRYTDQTTFDASDHRSYNRHGEAFDAGETFSGVDYATGVRAAAAFSALVTERFGDAVSPAQAALAWVVQQPGVTTVIPGARSTEQAQANAAAADVPDLGADFRAQVAELYDHDLRHHPRPVVTGIGWVV